MKDCCRETLRGIDDKLEAAEILAKLLGVSTLVTWLGSNPIDIAFGMLTTEWSTVESAVRSVPAVAKHASKKLADNHALYHHNDPVEYNFWRNVASAFV